MLKAYYKFAGRWLKIAITLIKEQSTHTIPSVKLFGTRLQNCINVSIRFITYRVPTPPPPPKTSRITIPRVKLLYISEGIFPNKRTNVIITNLKRRINQTAMENFWLIKDSTAPQDIVFIFYPITLVRMKSFLLMKLADCWKLTAISIKHLKKRKPPPPLPPSHNPTKS